MVKRYKNIPRREFLKIQFKLLNAMRQKHMELTPKEIEVAIEFFVLEDPYSFNRFSSKSRNKVIERLADRNIGISNATLNQHIIALHKKLILVRETDNNLVIHPVFKPLLSESENSYEFKFIFENVVNE